MPSGIVNRPGRHGLRMARITSGRLVGSLPPPGPGGVARSPGVGLFSNIFKRSPTAAHARLRRLSFTRALLPVKRDQVQGPGPSPVGTNNSPPFLFGTAGGMLDKPRIRMFKVFMNPKFGVKTRPC